MRAGKAHSFTSLPWKSVVFVIYFLCIRNTEFCVLASSAVWWLSVELQSGGVTFRFDGLTLLKYSIDEQGYGSWVEWYRVNLKC